MKSLISGIVVCGFLAASLYAAKDTLLTSFESEEEVGAWSGGEVVSQNASQGSHAYRVMPGGTAEAELEGDWSQYR